MNDCVFGYICEDFYRCDCSQCKEYLSMNEGRGADIHAEYQTRREQVIAWLLRVKAKEREKMEDDKK